MTLGEAIKQGKIKPSQRTAENNVYAGYTPKKDKKETFFGENIVDTIGSGATYIGEGFLGSLEGTVDWARNRVGNIGGLLGNKDFEEEMYKQSAMDTTNFLLKPAKEVYDKTAIKENGLLANVLKGTGQIGAMVGAGGLGVPGPLSIGTSSAGGGEQEALASGATKGQALAYSTLKGGLSAGTEYISGGIGGVLGKGAIDKVITDKLVSRVSSEVGKKLLNFGLKSAFEGVEENIEGFIDPLIKRLTYDKKAQGYFTDDNGKFTLTKAGNDWLVGTLTSALVQSPGTLLDISNKTSYKSNAQIDAEGKLYDLSKIDTTKFNKKQLSNYNTKLNTAKVNLYSVLAAEGKIQPMDITEATQPSLELQTPATQQNIPTTTETPLQMAENAKIEGVKQDYRGSHQISAEESTPITNLNIDNIVKEVETQKGGLTKQDYSDLTKLKKISANPEMEVKIYRSSPVNELNQGDWVTTNKDYANTIKQQNGGEVYTYTVKAGDLNYSNDIKNIPSLATFSAFMYNPKTQMQQQIQPMQKDVLPQEKQVIYEQEQAPYNETEILTKVEKAPIGDKLEAFKDGMQQAFTNDMHYVYKVANELGDDRIIPLTNNAKQANASAQYAIEQEFRNLFGTSVEGKSLLKTFEGINQKGEAYKKDVFTYLVNKHNIDRINADKPALVDVNGKIKTAEQSQKTVDNLIRKNPEFENIANEIYQYEDNLLQVLKDGQILSDEQIDNLKATYPFYVPLFRDVDTSLGVGAYGTAMGTQNPLKKAKGITPETNKAILPIDETMAAQTIKYFNAAKKNLMFKGILDAVRNNPKLASKYAVEIKDVEDIDIEQEITGDNLDNALKKEGKANTLTVYENGKKVKMEISKELYHSLLQMTNESLTKKVAKLPGFKQSAMAVKGVKTVTTAADLTFTLVTNPTKDIQNALMNTEDTKGYIQKFPEAIKKIAEGSEDWKQFLSMGSFQSGVLYGDDFMYKGKALTVANKAFQAIEVIEQIPRFAEFLRVKYSDPALVNDYNQLLKAMYAASEVTINFGKGGEVTKFVDRYFVPYLNASVQGASKISQNLTGKNALRYVLKAALMGATPALLNALMYSDDDDYKNLNQYEKDNYYQIKVNGQFISIPKGQLNAATGTITNLLMDATSGEEITADKLGKAFKNVVGQVGPVNPFDSNILSTFNQLNANKNWAGNRIVPDRLKDKPAKEQYDANTTSLAINIGNILNMSPKKIDYIIAQYTGGLGKAITPLMTKAAEPGGLLSYPWKKFATDPVFSNKNIGLFYDTYEDLLNKKKSKNATSEDYKNFSVFSGRKPSIDALYSQIRKIQSSDISDADKLKQVREAQEKINKIAEQAIIKYKEIK